MIFSRQRILGISEIIEVFLVAKGKRFHSSPPSGQAMALDDPSFHSVRTLLIRCLCLDLSLSACRSATSSHLLQSSTVQSNLSEMNSLKTTDDDHLVLLVTIFTLSKIKTSPPRHH